MELQYNSPMKFDVAGALAEGYTIEEIGQEAGFDVTNARSEGYTDEEISQYLSEGSEPTGSIEVGKPTIEDTTTNPFGVQPLDTKASVPSMSIPMGLDPNNPEYINRDMDPDQLKEQLDAKYDYYKDPRSGKIVPSSRISGEAEATYDFLPGGGSKLGLFSLNAALEAGKAAPEVANHISDYMAKARPEMSELALDPKALSTGAKILIATHVDVPEEQIVKILAGVPSKDQSLHLALALHDTDFIKHAVAMGNDQTRAKLANILKAPNKSLMDVMGDTGKQMAEAQLKYSDMVKATQEIDQGKLRPVPELQELTTKLLDQFYLQPNNAQGTIRRLSAQLERNNGNLTLTDSVDMMPEINSLLGKAKSHNERAILRQLKDTMDDAITKLGTPEHRLMFDEARDSYAAAKSNEAIVEVVQKHTADMGRGTDWAKVHRELNELELRSPETADALRLTEAFSNKYGNNTKLARTATPQGINENSGGALGAWGYVVNKVKNVALKDRREAMKVQREILKAINRNGTELEFLDEVLRSPKIPDEVKYTFNGTSDWTSAVSGRSPEELVTMAKNDGAIDEVVANEMSATFERLRNNGVNIDVSLVKPEDISIELAQKTGLGDAAVNGVTFSTIPKPGEKSVIQTLLKDVATTDQDKATLVAHELNHTATMGAVRFAEQNPNSSAGLALNNVKGIMEAMKQTDTKLVRDWRAGNNNIFDDPKEFITWGLTYPEMRDQLKKFDFDMPDQGPKGVWDTFLDTIWDMQGLSDGPSRNSYDQLIDRSLELMKNTHKSYNTGVEEYARMFDTRDLGLSIDQEQVVKDTLNKGASTSNYKLIRSLPIDTKQSLANELFNSRDIDTAVGLTGNQTGPSVNYYGFTTKMPPSAFLKLAANRNNTLVDYVENLPMKGYDLDIDSRPYKKLVDSIDKIARKNNLVDVREALNEGDFEYINDLILEHGMGEQLNKALGIGSTRVPSKARDFAYNIARDLSSNKLVKLGPPKLWGDIKDGKIVINGHEGRHRSDAALELLGNDVNIPVDFQLTNDGFEMRRVKIYESVLDLPIVNQDGSKLNLTLRKLLPAGFDTSRLGGN